MPIITLTTDMGTLDYYVAAIKGNILMQMPDVTIVDVTHQIEPWNIIQAAYIIRNAYPNFPPGTIHIIGVDTEIFKDRKHVAIKYDNHYFIGTDNGIFSLMFDKKPDVLVELNIISGINPTFPTKDIFVKAACHIARGGTLEILGRPIEQLKLAALGIPATEENAITGKVIYIDNYENVITNVHHEIFKKVGKGRPFNILITREHYTIDKLIYSYSETEPGEIGVLINELGFIEIAINRGYAASLLGLKNGSSVRFYFD